MMSRAADPSMFQIGTAAPQILARRPPVARVRLGRTSEGLELITTRAGFDALAAEWTALFDRAGRSTQMFQTFNWLWHWANHFLAEDAATLAIVTVRDAGRLVAVLPLCVERVAGLKQLVFMGDPVSQYGDALAEPRPDQAALLGRALAFAIGRARVDVVRLAKVREDAALAPVMAARAASITGFEYAPFADLAKAGTLAAYSARFSNKCLKNRRRYGRRLDEHGTAYIDWTLSGRAAADAARATMIYKRAWLGVRGQLSRAFADPRADRFFADVCAGTQHPAGAAVSLLSSSGEIANAAITVTVKGRQAIHVLAYGLKFEKCAAGVLHVERLVEHAFETGVGTLDFLAPCHDYKREWADGMVRVADYALPVTLVGRAYSRVYLHFLREHLKTTLKQTPRAFAKAVTWAQAALQALRG